MLGLWFGLVFPLRAARVHTHATCKRRVVCQDTSDPGHFGPKTFRHHQTGAEVYGQFGTSAEVSFGHFGTSAELSRPRQIFRIGTVRYAEGL